MNQKTYYLQDSRSLTGDRVVFWAKNGCGYTTNLAAAEIFSEADAREHNNNRPSDIPILTVIADANTTRSVDMQEMCNVEPAATDEDNRVGVVLVKKNEYNGNDLFFYPNTNDLDKAVVLTMQSEAFAAVTAGHPNLTPYRLRDLHAIARLVMPAAALSLRGIKMPKLKRERKRTARINCGYCGKFFNPEKVQGYTCPHCDGDNWP